MRCQTGAGQDSPVHGPTPRAEIISSHAASVVAVDSLLASSLPSAKRCAMSLNAFSLADETPALRIAPSGSASTCNGVGKGSAATGSSSSADAGAAGAAASVDASKSARNLRQMARAAFQEICCPRMEVASDLDTQRSAEAAAA